MVLAGLSSSEDLIRLENLLPKRLVHMTVGNGPLAIGLLDYPYMVYQLASPRVSNPRDTDRDSKDQATVPFMT